MPHVKQPIRRNGLLMRRQGLLQVREVLGAEDCCCPPPLPPGGACCFEAFDDPDIPIPDVTLTIESSCNDINGFTKVYPFENNDLLSLPGRPASGNCWQAGTDDDVPCFEGWFTLCCCCDGTTGYDNCDNTPTCLSFCLHWHSATADGCNFEIGNGGFPISCSCDPFELEFTATIIELILDGCLCCELTDTVTIRITL